MNRTTANLALLGSAFILLGRRGSSNKDNHRPHKTFNTKVEPHAVYLEAWDHPTININMMGSANQKKGKKISDLGHSPKP